LLEDVEADDQHVAGKHCRQRHQPGQNGDRVKHGADAEADQPSTALRRADRQGRQLVAQDMPEHERESWPPCLERRAIEQHRDVALLAAGAQVTGQRRRGERDRGRPQQKQQVVDSSARSTRSAKVSKAR
jgi:hypothetical protein